ncbi:MAG: hypothetical protein HY455_01550 [Parcubacteria group bacterium]|nr:hypothetical protein [Parcubacteria group bacterium]
MDLARKGAEAPVDPFKSLAVTMRWTAATDLDLAVLAEPKGGGAPKMFYFGNINKDDGQGVVQALDAPPYIKLSGDAGVGDTKAADGKGNCEELKITSLAPWGKLHIMTWDYGAIGKGEGARFQSSGVTLEVKDDKGTAHKVALSLVGDGLAVKENVCVIATIDNTGAYPRLVNSSAAALFGGASGKKLNVNDLTALVRSAA